MEKNASEDDIKKAYRRLARKYHPDVNPGDPSAEQLFKEINEAYEVLSDPEKRARYDQFGHKLNGVPGGFDARDFTGFDPFGSIFEAFFGESPFGGGARVGPVRGADLRYDLEIELEEAASGLERTIKVERLTACEKCGGSGAKPGTEPRTCPTCHGRGQVQTVSSTSFLRFSRVETCPRCRGEGTIIETPCPGCAGAGRVRRVASVTVEIPPGVDTGAKLRVRGEGESGVRGGPSGDLYIYITVRPHEVFERNGNDLGTEVPLSFTQAALGDEITVPTIDGESRLRIPEGTQSG
ncbi:MAG: molecular chaperone DnaJ, partial [Firmicutes bacterium]|nr:molecular chaperone DnaJ [Bacillota bacterium]